MIPFDVRLSLLVVDDDEVDRMVVRRALSSSGVRFVLQEAASAEAGLEAARASAFDCIFLDYRLRSATGAELLRDLRAEGVKAPVIILTGFGDETVAVELMKAGASDYIPKSAVSPQRLAQSLRYAISLHAARHEAARAEAERHRYARRLRALADAAPALYCSLTLETLLASAVERACEVLGATLAFVGVRLEPGAPAVHRTGRASGISLAVSDEPDWFRVWAHVGAARSPVRVSTAQPDGPASRRGASRDAPERTVLAAPLLARDGSPFGVIQVADAPERDFHETDETLLAQLAQIVAAAVDNARLYRAAQDATEAREEVMAIVSHDLRAPLGTIELAMSLLHETVPGNPEVERIVTRAQHSAAHMNRLIEDLLEVARIDAGHLELDVAEVPTSAILAAAAALSGDAASAAGVKLRIVAGDGLPAVRVDAHRAQQVATNLLGNAIKFTPAGGAVELSAVAHGALVRFSVRDTGPGISDDDRQRLFDRFWQRKNAPRSGVGLGLYIAKTIVEAHGGTIWVDVAERRGATFHFTLPAVVKASDPAADSRLREPA